MYKIVENSTKKRMKNEIFSKIRNYSIEDVMKCKTKMS